MAGEVGSHASTHWLAARKASVCPRSCTVCMRHAWPRHYGRNPWLRDIRATNRHAGTGTTRTRQPRPHGASGLDAPVDGPSSHPEAPLGGAAVGSRVPDVAVHATSDSGHSTSRSIPLNVTQYNAACDPPMI